jgi:hypothetical protein
MISIGMGGFEPQILQMTSDLGTYATALEWMRLYLHGAERALIPM